MHPQDEQLYKRIAEIANQSLEIVNRSSNLGTKLTRLDLAEGKIRDLLWLAPENNAEALGRLLKQIEEQRPDIVRNFALPEVQHQIKRAEKTKSGSVRMSALTKAGTFIAYCIDELEDSPELQELTDRLRTVGGEPIARERPDPLSMSHTKLPPPSSGCLIGLLALVVGIIRGPRA